MEQLAQRRTGGVEELQCVVGVVGQQPARDRVADVHRRGLVDRRVGGRVGVDEPQLQPGQDAEPGRQVGRRCGGGRTQRGRGALGQQGVGQAERGQPHGQIEHPTVRVHQPQPVQPQPTAADHVRQPVRRGDRGGGGGLGEGHVSIEAEEVVVQPIQAADQHVGPGGGQGQGGQILRLGVADDAGAVEVGVGFRLQELVDRRGQGPGARAVQQRPAEQGVTGQGRRRTGRVEVDLAQRPGADLVGGGQVRLPLRVHRHPRLAPVGDPDRGRLHAFADRDVQQLADVALPGVQMGGQHHLGLQPVADLGLGPAQLGRDHRDQMLDRVRVAQRGLADQFVALDRQSAVAEGTDHDAALQQVGVPPDRLGGEPAGQPLAGIEPAVVAVPQRPVGPAYAEHRLGRGVPPGVGPDDAAEGRGARWSGLRTRGGRERAAGKGQSPDLLDLAEGDLLGGLPGRREGDLHLDPRLLGDVDHLIGVVAAQARWGRGDQSEVANLLRRARTRVGQRGEAVPVYRLVVGDELVVAGVVPQGPVREGVQQPFLRNVGAGQHLGHHVDTGAAQGQGDLTGGGALVVPVPWVTTP